MGKKLSYTVLSSKRCKCGRALKANVVNRKPKATRCYNCHRHAEAMERGHYIKAVPRWMFAFCTAGGDAKPTGSMPKKRPGVGMRPA